MKKVTFINGRGEQIVFDHSPFFLSSFTGTGEVATDIQTQKAPYQDGVTVLDTLLQPRAPHLEGALTETRNREIIAEQKAEIFRVCNPKLGNGTLRYEYDGGVKEITAACDGMPVFVDPDGKDPYHRFSLDFFCESPYWRSFQQSSQVLQAYVGNFRLPVRLPVQIGFAGSSTDLVNQGHVKAPISIDIHGPVTNPQIINETTGEYMRINRSIAADEIMHIDTTPNQKRIEVFRNDDELINAFGDIDFPGGSTLWQLDVGINKIKHIADAGNADALVVITWHDLFSGI